MDSRQFRLGMLIVIALVLVVGTIGFFVIRNAEIQRKADIQQAEIQRQVEAKEQEMKTERTQERWDVLQRIPFLGDGEDTK
jgi:uncharacterized protein HemX